ncbi:OpgC domain-containing protein [Paraburkholderia sp.]|uniref:OpgC domain-containing protein n=1 Tax=Paraburkholderia sp. TaxID=1926495 RepID=UPI0025F301B6|nr:OpgC domain-containing protein [Paraburkholderia sp.]
MSQPSSRLVELDFFRGLVLLVIVVDHIGGSILSRFTLHTYALCDAAEVFVFLGGYASATAWAALCARRTEAAARQRFIRRAFEIYRAFVVTALLMLLVSAILVACDITAPNLTVTDLDDLAFAPAAALSDIVLLRRQPYLAGVLPMYAWFALAAPLALPLAYKKPWWLLALSLALWGLAPLATPWLPHAAGTQWDFNPFGWQLMFVFGVIARAQPVFQRVSAHRLGWIVTLAALAIVVACAAWRLSPGNAVFDSDLKRNLAWFRALNFLGIAWLTAHTVRLGWTKRLACALPWIGLVGRKGLLSFVAGAVISLVIDSLLYWYTDGYLDVPLGLAADALALGSLMLVVRLSGPLERLLPAKVKVSA